MNQDLEGKCKLKCFFLVKNRKVHYLCADSYGQVEKEKIMEKKGRTTLVTSLTWYNRLRLIRK